MTIEVNSAGAAFARECISAGRVNKSGGWSFDASDGNSLLGSSGDDWANYSKRHLAVDTSAPEDTKARYKYPVAKANTLYRAGLIAAKQRAAQQGETAIENAASKLLDKLPQKSKSSEVLMSLNEFFVAPTEFKFVDNSDPGVFSGYGAIFNKIDSHGDVIEPGAFTESLMKHQAKGTMPGLYVEHSAFTGGDPLPVGVWTEMKQDANGLAVRGKLSALDTEHGRRIR